MAPRKKIATLRIDIVEWFLINHNFLAEKKFAQKSVEWVQSGGAVYLWTKFLSLYRNSGSNK